MTKTDKLYLYSLTEIHSYSNSFHSHTLHFIRRTECPECHNTRIHYDDIRDELVCRKCGLVLESSAQYSSYTKIQYPFHYKYIIKLKQNVEVKIS